MNKKIGYSTKNFNYKKTLAILLACANIASMANSFNGVEKKELVHMFGISTAASIASKLGYDSLLGLCDCMLLSGNVHYDNNKLETEDKNIKIYVSNNVSDECRVAFDVACEYLNTIFNVINPSYKFCITSVSGYNDILVRNMPSDKMDIKMKTVMRTWVKRFNSEVFIHNQKEKIGNQLDAVIEILNTSGYTQGHLNYIVLHELFHVLGLKDHESTMCNKPHRSIIDYSDLDYLAKISPDELKVYPKDIEAINRIYGVDKDAKKVINVLEDYIHEPVMVSSMN